MIDLTGIDRLPSGAYRFRVRHRGELLSGTAPTPELAAQMRDELKRQIVDGDLTPTKGQTAVTLGPRFLGSRLGNRSSDDDTSRWHRHVATAAWARRAPATVTRADGVAWLKTLKRKRPEPPPNTDPKRRGGRRAERLSWSTRRHCRNLASAFFEWCVVQTPPLAAANPFAGLSVEREDGDEDEGYQDTWYLDGKEQVAFLKVWDSFRDTRRREKWIVAFALGTGIRLGELCCLHLSDVHVDAAEPHIVVRFGSWDTEKKRYRSPKGRKGEKRARVVPLFGIALEAARAWLAQLPEYAPKNPLHLMFPTERGQRRTKPPRSWPVAIEQFGVVPRIGERVWWHLLRHTCASSMVSGWWGMRWDSLQDVSKVLGHTDVRTTQIYAHLAPRAVQETAARAHAAYAASRGHNGVTAQRPTARKPRNDGRARQDSNLRHSASKASGTRQFIDESARRDRGVTAIRHVLELVRDEQLVLPMSVVAGLGDALDLALCAVFTEASHA